MSLIFCYNFLVYFSNLPTRLIYSSKWAISPPFRSSYNFICFSFSSNFPTYSFRISPFLATKSSTYFVILPIPSHLWLQLFSSIFNPAMSSLIRSKLVNMLSELLTNLSLWLLSYPFTYYLNYPMLPSVSEASFICLSISVILLLIKSWVRANLLSTCFILSWQSWNFDSIVANIPCWKI